MNMSDKPKLWDLYRITNQHFSKGYGHKNREKAEELLEFGGDLRSHDV